MAAVSESNRKLIWCIAILKIGTTHSSTPPQGVVWCVIKQRDNFALYVLYKF